jgi:carboxyl-terminal processing protease
MPRALAVILLTIVSVISLNAVTGFTSVAIESTEAAGKLVPIEKQAEQTALYREIFDRLATRHYRGQRIDDQLSKRYLEQYLDQLDPLKSYFLQSDIDEFNQWQTKLDDLAKRGDVKPGFVIFNRLRERAATQLAWNIDLLQDTERFFDYAGDDSLVLDADERDWLSSTAEAEIFWQKRVRDSMIRLLLNGKEEAKAKELLIKRYENQIKQFEQRDSQDVFQLYINALAALYDPHTSYFSPRTTENFQINMSLSLEGIGAELTTEDEYTKVVRIIPGGPADLQGILKAEDKIIGVGQDDEEIVDVVGWRLDDVVDLIRGAKDSTVRLEVIPGSGEAADSITLISIVRDKVKLEEKSAQSKILEIEQEGQTYKLGVIDIPAFYLDFEAYRNRDPNYKSTTRDVSKLLIDLSEQQVDGIVLDLRNNGGGSLFEATALTDLFIDRGPVVQIRDANQRIYRNQRATMPALYNGPMLVMINRLSASASEIFAGALQDYGRALIVGSRSYGKGTVQDVTGLTSGQLKLTISKFYRVSGDSTQHRGVLPDIAFPSAYDPEEVGESHQDNALPWDQIRGVPHANNSQLQDLVEPLTRAHLQRSAADPDYANLVDILALTKNWNQDQALSLNIEKRRERSAKWDTELFSLENIRRSKKGLMPYADIETWKQAEDPEEENIAESDPLLQEAGHILTDQILLQAGLSKLVSLNWHRSIKNQLNEPNPSDD